MGQDGTAASGGIRGEDGDPIALTRRALLRGAAAAGAGSLIAPSAGFAHAAPQRLSTRWVGSLSGESAPILTLRSFAMAGVEWVAPRAARIELRAEDAGGRWSPWVAASVLGHDGDGQPASPHLFGEPIWTGPARRVQLRADRHVDGLRVHLIAAATPRLPGQVASAPPLALPVLDAGPGQPPIIARSAWAGARAIPVRPPQYSTVKLAFVHHTETPNGYGPGDVPSILRTMFDYHVYVRGWWDIGYNFAIDAFGRIWEARAGGIDMAVVGSQAGGYNLESTGVGMIGSFTSALPSQAARGALDQLLAWKLSLHGVPVRGRVTVVVSRLGAKYTPFAPGAHVSLPRIAGHRDGDSTSCPGDALYQQLPAIRSQVAALAGAPAVLTFAAPNAPVAAGSPITVSGRLELLSGSPMAGAPIELQQLGRNGAPASTIATTTTAADGSWSFPLSSETNVFLRALHRPHPAAVADWELLAVSPVLTLQLQSSSPLVVTGTITPAKRRVTVALYPASRTTGKPLARRRVTVNQGQFTAQLPVPGPGDYVVIARSKPDPSHAASASAPLSVTVA